MAYTSVKYSNTWLGAEGKGDSILLGQTCLQWSFPQAEFGGWRKAEDCNPNALSLTVLTEKSKNSLNPWTIFVSICCMPLEWFLETLSCMVIIQFSRSVVSDSLWPHALQHAQASLSITNSQSSTKLTSLSQWCHPAISSSVVPFSSCPQSLPASESFPMSQFFASGGQSIGVSALASVLSKNTQDWSPLEWTGWISFQSKGLSRVFSNTTVQKHQFIGTQLSSQSNFHIHTWPLEKP